MREDVEVVATFRREGGNGRLLTARQQKQQSPGTLPTAERGRLRQAGRQRKS